MAKDHKLEIVVTEKGGKESSTPVSVLPNWQTDVMREMNEAIKAMREVAEAAGTPMTQKEAHQKYRDDWKDREEEKFGKKFDPLETRSTEYADSLMEAAEEAYAPTEAVTPQSTAPTSPQPFGGNNTGIFAQSEGDGDGSLAGLVAQGLNAALGTGVKQQRERDKSSDEHDDRDEAIGLLQGGSGGSGGGGGDDDSDSDDPYDVGGIIEDTGDALGDAASDIPFVGGTASGAIKGTATAVRAGLRIGDKAIRGASDAAIGLGTEAAGSVTGLIAQDNATEGIQALTSPITAVTGALENLSSGIPIVGAGFSALDGIVGGLINTFTGLMGALEQASEEVMGFNPDILTERLSTEIALLEKKMQRAQLAGDEMAEFEAARGDFLLALEDIKTVLVKVFMPIAAKILKMLTKAVEWLLANLPRVIIEFGREIQFLGQRLELIMGLIGAWIRPIGRQLTALGFGIQDIGHDMADAIDQLNNAGRGGLDFNSWLGGQGMIQHAGNVPGFPGGGFNPIP